jgi:hypothetical protein
LAVCTARHTTSHNSTCTDSTHMRAPTDNQPIIQSRAESATCTRRVRLVSMCVCHGSECCTHSVLFLIVPCDRSAAKPSPPLAGLAKSSCPFPPAVLREAWHTGLIRAGSNKCQWAECFSAVCRSGHAAAVAGRTVGVVCEVVVPHV